MGKYVILDLEMCMAKGKKHEIIQIGAVLLDESYRMVDEFATFVHPEYGKVNKLITELTGITEEDLKNAPLLRGALMKFVSWIGEREVTILSWSDTDYYQLEKEMQLKKINCSSLRKMMRNWVDFQYSFKNMLNLEHQYALKDAMKVGKLQMLGRMHDGLCDAYNTARLFAKIHRQEVFQLELVPIVEYKEKSSHLNFSLGELFSPELFADMDLEVGENETNEREVQEWSFLRKVLRVVRGKKAASQENWNKYLFGKEMRKINHEDRKRKAFTVEKCHIWEYNV